MAPAPFPPPNADDVRSVADILSDWQTTAVFVLTGIGAAMAFVARSAAHWARKTTEKTEAELKAVRADIEDLKAARHTTDLRIVALESLSREVERLGRSVDLGFERVNERLDDIGKSCLVFHSRSSAGE